MIKKYKNIVNYYCASCANHSIHAFSPTAKGFSFLSYCVVTLDVLATVDTLYIRKNWNLPIIYFFTLQPVLAMSEGLTTGDMIRYLRRGLETNGRSWCGCIDVR